MKLMQHIQGTGIYTPKKKDGKAQPSIPVIVEAITRNNQCTLLLPDGSRRQLALDSVEEFKPTT